jgi:hypothetical protein
VTSAGEEDYINSLRKGEQGTEVSAGINFRAIYGC